MHFAIKVCGGGDYVVVGVGRSLGPDEDDGDDDDEDDDDVVGVGRSLGPQIFGWGRGRTCLTSSYGWY